jgi:hypothetical protein
MEEVIQRGTQPQPGAEVDDEKKIRACKMGLCSFVYFAEITHSWASARIMHAKAGCIHSLHLRLYL